MYALYHLLRQFYTRQPDVLRRAQVLTGVDNQFVVGAFSRGWAKNRKTHALLVQLFVQVEYGFMFSLKWIPTAENGVADAMSRPSREAIIHIAPAAFRAIRDEMGPFNLDLMAHTTSVLRSPDSGEALPFFSPYDCASSAGTDALA